MRDIPHQESVSDKIVKDNGNSVASSFVCNIVDDNSVVNDNVCDTLSLVL